MILDSIIVGDAASALRTMPSDFFDVVITSPPYFQQRDYTDNDMEIGRESEFSDYLDRLLAVFDECVRVIKPSGNIVFNVGDKYKDGSLLLVPHRFAIAASDRAKLINAITWVKMNPTPRQGKRRMVSATEPFFHFVKSKDYFYNYDVAAADAPISKKYPRLGERYVNMIHKSSMTPSQKEMALNDLSLAVDEVRSGKIGGVRMKIMGLHALPFGGQIGGRLRQMQNNGYTIIKVPGKYKMLRDVIVSKVENLKGTKHPAVYPCEVVEKILKIMCPPGGIVLDPFIGSGTTGVVCKRMGLRYVGVDLNAEYVREAERRIESEMANEGIRRTDIS